MSFYPKQGRAITSRVSRPKKRKFHGNRYSESDESLEDNATANKILTAKADDVVKLNHFYRIIEFVSVFAAIQEFVICRNCKNNTNFYETSPRGLGFKIAARCGCETRFINSGPMINSGFEINRRIVLMMRLLGVGLQGLNLFCNNDGYWKRHVPTDTYGIINHLYDAAKIVFDAMCLRVIQQEKKENAKKREKPCSLQCQEMAFGKSEALFHCTV